MDNRVQLYSDIISFLTSGKMDWINSDESSESILHWIVSQLPDRIPPEVWSLLIGDVITKLLAFGHGRHIRNISFPKVSTEKEIIGQPCEIIFNKNMCRILRCCLAVDTKFKLMDLVERIQSNITSYYAESIQVDLGMIDNILGHINDIIECNQIDNQEISNRIIRAHRFASLLGKRMPIANSLEMKCNFFYSRVLIPMKRLVCRLNNINNNNIKVNDGDGDGEVCTLQSCPFMYLSVKELNEEEENENENEEDKTIKHCVFHEEPALIYAQSSHALIYALKTETIWTVPVVQAMVNDFLSQSKSNAEQIQILFQTIQQLIGDVVNHVDKRYASVWILVCDWVSRFVPHLTNISQLPVISIDPLEKQNMKSLKRAISFVGTNLVDLLDWNPSIALVLKPSLLQKLFIPEQAVIENLDECEQLIELDPNPEKLLHHFYTHREHLQFPNVTVVHFQLSGQEGSGMGCLKQVLRLTTDALFRSESEIWTEIHETGYYCSGPKMDKRYARLSAYLLSLHILIGLKFPYHIPNIFYLEHAIKQDVNSSHVDKGMEWIKYFKTIDPIFAQSLESLYQFDSDNQLAEQEYESPITKVPIQKKDQLYMFIKDMCIYHKLGGQDRLSTFQSAFKEQLVGEKEFDILSVSRNLVNLFDNVSFDFGSDLLYGTSSLDATVFLSSIRYQRTTNQNFSDIRQELLWFRQFVEQECQDPELCAKLYTFITGIKYFSPKNQIVVQVDMTSKRNNFPIATTCYNILYLPPYDSFEIMKRRLLFMLDEVDLGTLTLV